MENNTQYSFYFFYITVPSIVKSILPLVSHSNTIFMLEINLFVPPPNFLMLGE